MTNTSATGGYLLGVEAALPGGLNVVDFLQAVISGITGIGGDLVRPRWQIDPPKIPDISVDWCAFGITNQKGDANAYFQMEVSDAYLSRHEELDIFCIFYGPNAHSNAGALRDGLQLSQNREKLYLAAMGFVDSSDITSAPEKINERWFNRADMTIKITRQIIRTYQVLSFLSANGEIITDTTPQIEVPWSVSNE